MIYAYSDSPFGLLEAGAENGRITSIMPVEERLHIQTPDALFDETFLQLGEYFSGRRKAFTLPLDPRGTAFQKAVWNALLDIPYGQTRTYGEIAAAVGKPGASRAVGGANHKNSIIIVIPCHRAVGTGGRLTGYGCGLPMKAALLELEKSESSDFKAFCSNSRGYNTKVLL